MTGCHLSGIIFFVLCESRSANMESWLSGRRRTIGNRVGVMSVSRVQIPDSPPDYRTLSKDKVRFLLLSQRKRNYVEVIAFFDDNPDDNHAFLEITVV